VKIIRFNQRSTTKNIVLALGNFDGVHRGHAKVIQEAVKFARAKKLSCFAMTFDPHPQEVVSPKRGLQLLTTLGERALLLKSLGIDGVIVKKFNKSIAAMPPEKFIKDFLVDQLKVKRVFVGFDFAFGRARSGNFAMLEKAGLEVHVVPPYKVNSHLVKSSSIRELIAGGSFNKGIKLLGHPYIMTGLVVKGMGKGREIGFPTVNLKVAFDKLIPEHGVYAGSVLIGPKTHKKCAIFIGSRSVFGETFAIEAHIIGYHGNLRGRNLTLEISKRVRDEKHFSDVDKLISQIRKDVRKIRGMNIR
jgi:riboflavin kinase/FMN adenylyltransferase